MCALFLLIYFFCFSVVLGYLNLLFHKLIVFLFVIPVDQKFRSLFKSSRQSIHELIDHSILFVQERLLLLGCF